MNEELVKIREDSIRAKIEQYRPEATAILEEAYHFFKENPEEYKFEKKRVSISDDLMSALSCISKEPKYKFRVSRKSTFFGGDKLVIYVDENYISLDEIPIW